MAKIIKLNQKIRDYNLGNDFILETVENDDMYEAWIYHKGYGIKSSIFGLQMKDCAYPYFLELVLNDIDTHIAGYIEDFAPELEGFGE